VGDGLLWPDFVHKKPSQTLQKLSFEGGSQVQLPPSRDKGGCGYSVVSNSRGSLFFFERKNWWAQIKEPTLNCQFFDENPQFLENSQILILYSRGSLFDSDFFSENPNQQFCGCIRKLLLLLNFKKTKKTLNPRSNLHNERTVTMYSKLS
jgi:hypothetical protein